MGRHKNVKYRVKCEECGSEDISSTASVYWDVKTQSWITCDEPYGERYDNYCNDCDENTLFLYVPIVKIKLNKMQH